MKVDSAYKVFAELPDLTSPIQQTDHPTRHRIGIIPVFADIYFNKRNFYAFLKAAIYSRQTFLLHTDASEKQTAIKLYIELSLKDQVLPVLRQNGLNTETDVLWFDAPPLPNTFKGDWSRYGKKTKLFWDAQLATYEQVIFWDADLFKLPQPTSYDIFDRSCYVKDVLAMLRVSTLQRRVWRPKFIRRSVQNVQYSGLSIQEIFEKAGLGRTLQAIPGDILKPLNGFGVYPAKHFHEHHRDFIAWLQTHAPYIGDDEYCVALGSAIFNIPLQSFRNAWGNLTHVATHAYIAGDTHHSFLHGKSIPSHVKLHSERLKEISDPANYV